MYFTFQYSEIEILQKRQEYVKGNTNAYTKISVLLFASKKHISTTDIAQSLGVNESTVYRYINIYFSDGIEVLLRDNRSGYTGLLKNEQIEKLRIELNKNLYTESKQVIHYIKSTFEREYSVSGVVDLLHRIGFSYKQTKQVPCESNPEEQKKFIEKITKIQGK